MVQKIVPHLWFDTEAMEAVSFYTSLFEDSRINWATVVKDTPSGDSEQFSFTLAGQEFLAISAGPYTSFSPAVSLSVYLNTVEETEALWEKLLEGGSVLMPLDTYPFSKRYGWLNDKYGLSWQITYAEEPSEQKIIPSLLFVGEHFGKAEEAIHHYLSVFKNSSLQVFVPYEEDMEPNKAGTVMFSAFQLEDLAFIAMDGALEHTFHFNESLSFIVYCDSQEEIDYYWEKLSAVPEAEECGWLKDQFGVSWQIIPRAMDEMMLSDEEEKKARAVAAFLKMKKLDIAEIQRAYDGV